MGILYLAVVEHYWKAYNQLNVVPVISISVTDADNSTFNREKSNQKHKQHGFNMAAASYGNAAYSCDIIFCKILLA